MSKMCENGSKCDFGKDYSTKESCGNNNFTNTQTRLSSAFRHISLYTLAIALFVFMLIITMSQVFAIQDLMALQGNVNNNGLPIATGNLTVTIWDSSTGGSLLYDSSTDYNNAIVAGKFDIMLGDGSQNLVLEYGRFYYMDMSVNGQDLDFNGTERRIFQSTIGNVNASYIQNANWLSVNDQRFNETTLINNVNTTANIQNLGFNTTVQLDGKYYSSANPLGFVNSSGLAFYNETTLINNVNTTGNIQNLGFNTTIQLSSLYLGVNDQRFNSSSRIDLLNVTKLNVTDQRFNETTLITNVNTTGNIQFLGFNTTVQLSNLFYSLTNPLAFINASGIVSAVGNWSLDKSSYNTTSQLNTLYLGIADQRFNESGRVDLLNSSKLNISDQRFNETTLITNVNTSGNIQSLGFNTTTQLDGRYYSSANPLGFVNSSGLALYNETTLITNVNTTGNIQNLGFNTTVQLDGRYYSSANPLGFVNSSGLALYNETTLIVNVNTSGNIQSLGFNTTVQLDGRYYSSVNPLGFVNSSGLALYNETTLITNVNTTGNIKILGFNTTTELNTLYYALTNPLGFVNITGIVSAVGNWSLDKSSYNTTSQLTTLFLGLTDQRFNETTLANNVNTTGNIQSLGFNTTTQLNTLYLGIADQRFNESSRVDLLNSTKLNITDQRFNETTLANNVNTSGNIQNLGFNTTTQLNTLYLGIADQRFNESSRVDLLNSTKLNITDQRFNETTLANNVNTSGNIQNLGFNTTTQLDTRFVNVNDEINVTNINATNSPVIGQTLTYAGSNDKFEWIDTAEINYTDTLVSTTSATAFSIIRNLTHVLNNASTYLIECRFITYSAALGTGEQLQINTTGTPTKVTWVYNTQVSATTRTSFQGVNVNTNILADTGGNTANIRDVGLVTGYVITAANPSVVTYELRSDAAGSAANVDAGSFCQYTKVK